MKLCIVNILLLCVIGTHYVTAAGICAGCPTEGDVQDKDVLELLNKGVAQQNSRTNEEPKRVVAITNVSKQVVAGIKYKITFDAETLNSNKKMTCQTTLLHQPWITKEPQILDFKCSSSVSKRSFPGEAIDVTTKESEQVKELAEMGIETLDELDEDDNKRIVTNVISAKKKFVNGIMYDISVEVKTSSCKEKEEINDKCVSVEVAPLKICNLHIYRSFADKSPHNAKVVKSECFMAKKGRSLEDKFDIAEHINRAVTYGIKRINSAINNNAVFGLANILESDHVHKSGLHQTSLTLELGSTNCTKRKSYKDSECLLLPGLEEHMICTLVVKHDKEQNKLSMDDDFSCKNIKNYHTLSNRARRALIGGVRPLDLEAENLDDIKTYILLDLNQRNSNSKYYKAVVKIIAGSVQLSTGRILKLLVEIADTNCPRSQNMDIMGCSLQDEGRELCQISVWERPWLMRKDITNSTCYPIHEAMSAELFGVDENDSHYIKFKNFTKKFQRSYKTTDELKKRFRVFRANMKKADVLQLTEQGTAKYGVTMFSDLTSSEFKKNYLGLKKRTSEPEYKQQIAHIPNITLPDEYDWRNYNVVTPVKNQGLCGSCWAFSVTGNIEGQYAIKTGNLISLSEQELVDCDKYDDGCEGGLFDTAYHAIEDLGGLESESDYPYSANDGHCHFNRSEVRVSITSSVNISTNETDMAKWLVANGPISIGLNANAMQFYLGGVSHPLKFLCDPKSMDHGVLIVGYGVHRYPVFKKTLPFWLIKNSWGENWGLQGYYMLYRGDGSCGVNQSPSSAVL